MAGVHEREYLPAVLEGGVELVEPDGAELAAFRDAVAPVYGKWRDLLGDPAVADSALQFIESA